MSAASEKKGFTEEEKNAIIDDNFSNRDKDTFLITTPRQVDRGALMSRYSRTDKPMRNIFIDEFATVPDRGEVFYKNVLGGYGDDSVAELGTVQFAVENVSQILTKMIEDRRLASYLEKSTRYVKFDSKVNGKYKFLEEPTIMESRFADTYLQACNLDFETYSKSIDPLMKSLKDMYPITDSRFFLFKDSKTEQEVPFDRLTVEKDVEKAQNAYNSSVRSRSLDDLRGLLPASTLTNVGITMNGRGLEHLMNIMLSSGLKEAEGRAREIMDVTKSETESFISRVNTEHGDQMRDYMRSVEDMSSKYSDEFVGHVRSGKKQSVKLIYRDPNALAEKKVVTALLHHASSAPMYKIESKVNQMDAGTRVAIIESFVSLRKNRRQKPPRAFENTFYTFDVVSDFGAFRDMHRHRILTLERQPLSTDHGFEPIQEVVAAGLGKEYKETMDNTKSAFEKIRGEMPKQAQYVVNMGFNYPYYMTFNLREATHMIELRSTPQGHPSYRKIVQSMYSQIRDAHPTLSKTIKFVDNDYYVFNRLASEKRIEEKKSLRNN